MSNVPYRPVVTEGDPKQKNPRCNITQTNRVHSGNPPSAAEMAAKGQAQYNAHRAEQEAWRKVKEQRKDGKREGQPSIRMLRPDQIK